MKLMIEPRLGSTPVAHESDTPGSLASLARACWADPATTKKLRDNGSEADTTDQADRLVFCSFPYEHETKCGFTGVAAVGCVCAVRDWEPEELIDGLDELIGRHRCQERLTAALAEELEGTLRPAGVGVILRRTPDLSWFGSPAGDGATLMTMKLKGVVRDVDELRREFLHLARHSFVRYGTAPAGGRMSR